MTPLFLKKELDSYANNIMKEYDNLMSLEGAAVLVEEKVKPLINVDYIYVNRYSPKLDLNLVVEHFRDLMDVLEVLEDNGFPCTSTMDYPQYNQREYECGKIRIVATPEGSNCKAVAVGSQPKYEFRCE